MDHVLNWLSENNGGETPSLQDYLDVAYFGEVHDLQQLEREYSEDIQAVVEMLESEQLRNSGGKQ